MCIQQEENKISEVYFCSDLHIGHKNIANFRKEMTSEQNNRDVIKSHWDSIVSKRDLVWVLGDAAFTEEAIDWIGTLSGHKRLVRGNHDDLPIQSYLKVFEEVYGLVKYKGLWLSHAPIHPDELRGKPNLHGHVHYHSIKEQVTDSTGFNVVSSQFDDKRYLNCCVENLMKHLGRPLINLREVRNYIKTGEYVEDKIVLGRSKIR